MTISTVCFRFLYHFTIALLVFICWCSFFAGSAISNVIDSPHNLENGISCADCHSYSAWWKFSLLSDTDLDYSAKMDTLCSKCHYSGSSMADGCGHSSIGMGEMHNPNLDSWSTYCLDCHDAHFQKQLLWRVNIPDSLYLVQGTIGGGASFEYTNEITSFAYSLGEFVPEIPWDDPANWSKKNNTFPERGLIFVVDTDLAEKTYEVAAADSSIISVHGHLDIENANKTFGLIYGQFIKSEITTPVSLSRDVQFFDPHMANNGFVNSQPPPKGLCQVCHDNTSVWRSESGSGDSLTHTGYGDFYCVGCHIPSSGFKAQISFENHSPVTINGGCDSTECHGPIVNHFEIEALHNPNGTGSCDLCHTSSRQAVIDAISTGSAACLDCHAEPTVHQPVFYDTNQVGVPLGIVDKTGTTIQQTNYLPFGASF